MRVLLPLLSVLFVACGPTVERVHGVFPCEVTADCDDDNDCSIDTCEDGRCRFRAVEDETACVDVTDAPGACSAGVCRP